MMHTWSSQWKIGDKIISLDKSSGTLEIWTPFDFNVKFHYEDPRELAKLLQEIADILLQCDYGVHDENDGQLCRKAGTVRRLGSHTVDGLFPSKTPASTLCDEHFRPEPEIQKNQEPVHF